MGAEWWAKACAHSDKFANDYLQYDNEDHAEDGAVDQEDDAQDLEEEEDGNAEGFSDDEDEFFDAQEQ